MESRLHLVPRYRQKLATVPLAQGRPLWVDDADFDIARHVKSTAVAPPGGADELRALAGRLFSRRLRRDRPLWEMYLVTGLADVGGRPRFAIVSKTHHAVVDGISGLDVMSVLFAPEGEVGAAERGRPSPRPPTSSGSRARSPSGSRAPPSSSAPCARSCGARAACSRRSARRSSGPGRSRGPG